MAYSEAECLESLLEGAEQLKRTPTMDEYDSLGLSPSANTIADRCGTWQLALTKAGLKQESRREYTRANCVNALQNAADILGKEPTREAYKKLGLRPSSSTIHEICGSWTEAKEIADVSDYGDKSPEEEAHEFFSKLENAEPVNKQNSE